MMNSTMRTINDGAALREQRLAYCRHLRELAAKHQITHIIAERYMLRRGGGGTAIESINMMLGMLLMLGLPTKLIPASQWKNDTHRLNVDLDALYAEGKESAKLTPHQIDACHIGAYAAGLLLNAPSPYVGLVAQLSQLPSMHLGEITKPPRKIKRKRKTKK